MKRGHWFAREHEFAFYVYSPTRDFSHIRLVYGDNIYNIPNYGTKEQARADAEFIADALNKRDGLI